MPKTPRENTVIAAMPIDIATNPKPKKTRITFGSTGVIEP